MNTSFARAALAPLKKKLAVTAQNKLLASLTARRDDEVLDLLEHALLTFTPAEHAASSHLVARAFGGSAHPRAAKRLLEMAQRAAASGAEDHLELVFQAMLYTGPKSRAALSDAAALALASAGRVSAAPSVVARFGTGAEQRSMVTALISTAADDAHAAALRVARASMTAAERFELLAPFVAKDDPSQTARARAAAIFRLGLDGVAEDPRWAPLLVARLEAEPDGADVYPLLRAASRLLRDRPDEALEERFRVAALRHLPTDVRNLGFVFEERPDARVVPILVDALARPNACDEALRLLGVFPPEMVAAPLRAQASSGEIDVAAAEGVRVLLELIAMKVPEEAPGGKVAVSPEVLRAIALRFDVSALEVALASGADPNATTGGPETLLHAVFEPSQWEVDLDLDPDGALGDSARRVRDVVRALVASGADPNARLRYSWRTDPDRAPHPENATPRTLATSLFRFCLASGGVDVRGIVDEIFALLGGPDDARKADLLYPTKAMAVVVEGLRLRLATATPARLESLRESARRVSADVEVVAGFDIDAAPSVDGAEIAVGWPIAMATADDEPRVVAEIARARSANECGALRRVLEHELGTEAMKGAEDGLWLVATGPLCDAHLIYGAGAKEPKRSYPGLVWEAPVSMEQERLERGALGVAVAHATYQGARRSIASASGALDSARLIGLTKGLRGKKGFLLVAKYDVG